MPNHLWVAHAPLVLIAVALALDVLGVLRESDEQRRWAGHLLVVGAFAALAAFTTGQGAMSYSFGRPQPDFAAIEAHSQWGGGGVWVLVIAGGLRLAWRHHTRGTYGWVNLGLVLVAGAVVLGIFRSGVAIAHP